MSAAGAIARDTDAKDLKFRTKDDWVDALILRLFHKFVISFFYVLGVSSPKLCYL